MGERQSKQPGQRKTLAQELGEVTLAMGRFRQALLIALEESFVGVRMLCSLAWLARWERRRRTKR